MMRSFLVIAAALTVAACGVSTHYEDTGQLTGYETRKVEVTYIDPPKRFSVNVRDVESGQMFNNVAYSKRCYSYDRYKVGAVLTVPFAVYTKKNGEQTRVLDESALNALFCS